MGGMGGRVEKAWSLRLSWGCFGVVVAAVESLTPGSPTSLSRLDHRVYGLRSMPKRSGVLMLPTAGPGLVQFGLLLAAPRAPKVRCCCDWW